MNKRSFQPNLGGTTNSMLRPKNLGLMRAFFDNKKENYEDIFETSQFARQI